MQVVKDPGEVNIVANTIHHINSIGALIDDALLIHSNGESLIKLESIKKLELLKTTSFRHSLLICLSALPLVYVVFAFKFTWLEQLLIGLYIVALIVFALYAKTTRYKLYVRKFDEESLMFTVNKYRKQEAKSMVSMVNRKLKQLRTGKA